MSVFLGSDMHLLRLVGILNSHGYVNWIGINALFAEFLYLVGIDYKNAWKY